MITRPHSLVVAASRSARLRVAAVGLLVAGLGAPAGAGTIHEDGPRIGVLPSARQYTAKVLPTLTGYPYPRVSEINAAGHVAGTDYACPFTLSCFSQAFLYDGETITHVSDEIIAAVPAPFVGLPAALDLGDGGHVLIRTAVPDVGVYHHLWHDGTTTLIDPDPRTSTNGGTVLIPFPPPPGVAWAVNESGTVVGTTDTGGYLWRADLGVVEAFGPPPGYSSISARDLNAHGHVVGSVGPATSSRGFLWIDGEFTILEPRPGDIASEALVIADDGTVAGTSLSPITGNWVSNLIVWRDGEIVGSTSLPFDDGLIMAVNGIGSTGEVVGNYWPTGSAFQHFAYRWTTEDGFQDVNGAVTNMPDLNVWSAEGTNDQGQLAAWGDFPDFTGGAFILDPLCAQDVDGNGAIDIDDIVAVVIAFGTDDPDADVDGSGVVDIDDLVEVVLNFGPCPGAAS